MHSVGVLQLVDNRLVATIHRITADVRTHVIQINARHLVGKEHPELTGVRVGHVAPLWQFRKRVVLVQPVEIYIITVFVLHLLYYRVAEGIGATDGIGAVLYAAPVTVQVDAIAPVGEMMEVAGMVAVQLTRNLNPAHVRRLVVAVKADA